MFKPKPYNNFKPGLVKEDKQTVNNSVTAVISDTLAAPEQTIQLYALESQVKTEAQLERMYGRNVDDLCNEHEKLIEKILEEEEQLIHSHRGHIDEVVSVVKDEMTLLNEVDKPGSDVEVYIRGLDEVLLKKMRIISGLREQLLSFYSHLKTEESMSRLYERNQELAELNNQSNFEQQTTQVSQQDQAYPANESGGGSLVDDILNSVAHDEGVAAAQINSDDLLGMGEDEEVLDDLDLLL